MERSKAEEKLIPALRDWQDRWAHAFEFRDPEITYDLLWTILDVTHGQDPS